MNSQFFQDKDIILKRLTLYNREDFDELIEKENVIPFIYQKNENNFVIILTEGFSDTKCPKCECPTIASVVDIITNKFINECVGCKLQFILEVQQM